MPIAISLNQYSSSKGFTYIMMLIAIVAISLFAGIAAQTSSSIAKAEKEKELIFRGLAYRNAIASYYKAGRLRKEYPTSLESLLKDPRFPNKHHIRQLYTDPITNTNKWTLVYGKEGGIIGVASKDSSIPIRKKNFPKGLNHFENAQTYQDWHFTWSPQKQIMKSNNKVSSKLDNMKVEH